MNYLKFAILVLIFLIDYVISDNNGMDSSFVFLSKTHPFIYSEIKDLIVFGDSYTTATIDYSTLQFNGQSSNNEEESKNWPLFLVKKRIMNMWNFACSGAVVDNDIIHSNNALPMTEQYKAFILHMGKGGKHSNWRSDQSLIGIWFGINDIMNRADNDIDYDDDQSIIKSMFKIINKIYDLGARNFLILDVPSLEKLPHFIYSPVKGLDEEVLKFNKMIADSAMNFQKSKPETNVFVYNAYNELNYIMKNENKFGFTITVDDWYHNNERKLEDITKEYFWRDGYHLSKYVQEALSQELDDFLSMNEKNSKELTHFNNQTNQNNEEECWSLKLNYPCCDRNNTISFYRNDYGAWGNVDNKWCGLYPPTVDTCFEKYFNKPCGNTDTTSTTSSPKSFMVSLSIFYGVFMPFLSFFPVILFISFCHFCF
ncbi:hypothetical protein H8356DRAFT_1639598 [Neocallimastix lanati (nom. inval.)]|jgi:hypothetical protein|uniref:CBM10 domain-containing protein n=1 Tax=Neocallimastix californiae TaxID=1754190 RepID=A0A1Y2ECS9_9FUNG|nr:hypothetical protein H8356DRAFT_1639598 [Neocallimastix sp. JGI-2020a]ORY69372.1 hypothetical protein LY90DRAFT_700287 [Neocallimastix californiae]|eukprot:ORY69372.1 hypothetical protein LY90DRAFT_700287 [Neocallimastix californiae]